MASFSITTSPDGGIAFITAMLFGVGEIRRLLITPVPTDPPKISSRTGDQSLVIQTFVEEVLTPTNHLGTSTVSTSTRRSSPYACILLCWTAIAQPCVTATVPFTARVTPVIQAVGF